MKRILPLFAIILLFIGRTYELSAQTVVELANGQILVEDLWESVLISGCYVCCVNYVIFIEIKTQTLF